MKKLILSILTVISISTLSYGQCTPDMSVTSGISPDTATGMAVSYVGQPYSEVFTFVIPTDTTYQNQTVPITHIKLESIDGLPANYDYACNPTDCIFLAGTTKCVDMFSTTDPTSAQVGSYPITINTKTKITLGFVPIDVPTDFEGYYLVISEPLGLQDGLQFVSIGEMKHLISYPNPTSGNTTIEYAMGYSSSVDFTVSNLLGEIVYSTTKSANKGLNNFQFDAEVVSNGVYIYSITDGKNTISKKLIVNK